MPGSAWPASSTWSTRWRWTTSRTRVGAIGHIEVYPSSRNIIAGRAVFTIDIRSPDKATLDDMDRRIRRRLGNDRRGAGDRSTRSKRSAISTQ